MFADATRLKGISGGGLPETASLEIKLQWGLVVCSLRPADNVLIEAGRELRRG